MNKDIIIKIATDFSRIPGARYPEEGDYSGQEFRQNVLHPALKKAIEMNVKLIVDLDGTAGLGTSFLEESFGGLIRRDHINYNILKQTLIIISDEDPDYKEEVEEISIIDAISLFLTIGCAIYISKVLEKEVQDVRIEKEMFISQVGNTESPLVELGNKLNSTTYTEVISLYSKSNITRHKLFKKIDSFKKSEFKVDDIKEVLDTNYKRLKPLLTDTSVMPKSPPDIEVKRGKITYSPERIVEIQENLQTIQDEFFKLKIIINRA